MRWKEFKSRPDVHNAILANRSWYGDGHSLLPVRFSAERTSERQVTVIEILGRAAKGARKAGDRQSSTRFERLADSLDMCSRRHRCGCLACLKCARAFQQAKADALLHLINRVARRDPKRRAVFVTVIPLGRGVPYADLPSFNMAKLNRLFRDRIARAGIENMLFGSMDFSLEPDFVQPHWHFVAWTNNPEILKKKLKSAFSGVSKGDRPVVVIDPHDDRYVAYLFKVIKIIDVLRTGRKRIPEFFSMLDRHEPLEPLILSKVRLDIRKEKIRLRRIPKSA